MRKLFSVAEQYIQESNWKTIAILKLCLLSLGIMLGMEIAPKYKKPVFFSCLAVFIASYIPLMAKLVRLFIAYED